MMQARAAGGHAMGAARDLRGAARHAVYAAGQAGAVAHVAAHELGAAACAIRAARAAAAEGESDAAGRLECRWQRDQLPDAIRELVLDCQRRLNLDPLSTWNPRVVTGSAFSRRRQVTALAKPTSWSPCQAPTAGPELSAAVTCSAVRSG